MRNLFKPRSRRHRTRANQFHRTHGNGISYIEPKPAIARTPESLAQEAQSLREREYSELARQANVDALVEATERGLADWQNGIGMLLPTVNSVLAAAKVIAPSCCSAKNINTLRYLDRLDVIERGRDVDGVLVQDAVDFLWWYLHNSKTEAAPGSNQAPQLLR